MKASPIPPRASPVTWAVRAIRFGMRQPAISIGAKTCSSATELPAPSLARVARGRAAVVGCGGRCDLEDRRDGAGREERGLGRALGSRTRLRPGRALHEPRLLRARDGAPL